MSTVHVSCGIFTGPPLSTDGGDPQIFSRGSKWSQGIYSCSSATRASIQTVTFSTNSSTDLQDMYIARATSGPNVLWATEKVSMNLPEIDLLWGRVDDRYEGSDSLWTIRAETFYLPAGSSSVLA
ncbi:hypothetical protein P691DRAFT_621809, partial [Macrolepiota fuliginosa MF-IS2]